MLLYALLGLLAVLPGNDAAAAPASNDDEETDRVYQLFWPSSQESEPAVVDPDPNDQCPYVALSLECPSGDMCEHAHFGSKWCQPYFMNVGCPTEPGNACPAGNHFPD